MTRYTLTPAAQADIANIWDYTAEQWNIDQAERYVGAIQRACATIASSRSNGRRLEGIRKDYRKFPVGSHIIIFRRIDSGVEIVRVLHARMDIPSRLED